MGWKEDQFVPSPELVEAVIADALRPAIIAACSALGVSQLTASIGVWMGNERPTDLPALVVGGMDDGGCSNAQVRLRFRRTFKPSRSLFFAQLKLDSPDDKS